MKRFSYCMTCLLLTLAVSSAFAGSERKIGTAGSQELLIPIGARGAALGGSLIANPIGLESVYWNPAGLVGIEGTEAMLSHQPYLADIDVNFGGIATNIEDFGAISFSAKVVSIGEIEETTEAQPEGTGNVYNPTLSVLGISYARQLNAQVAFGTTMMLINESIFEVSASGLAFDFGVTYQPNWNGITLGLAIKNYGPNMRFSGPGFQRIFEEAGVRQLAPNSAEFELPSSLNIGLAWRAVESGNNALALHGNFRANNFQSDFWQGGAEYSFNNRYFLRGGYNFATEGNTDDYLYGASLGFGLVVPFGNSNLTVEYAWNQTDVFDDNQFFTFKIGF